MLRTLRPFVLVGLVATASTAMAQSVGINPNGAAPNANAMLDINVSTLPVSQKRGLLIPRMLEVQRTAIPAPANGLWVYQTNDGVGLRGLWYYDAALPGWVRMSSSVGWTLSGNAGTNPAIQYLGTSDPTDLVFRTNNVARMRISAGGLVGINQAAPVEAMDVNGSMRLNNGASNNLTNQAGVIRYNTTTTFHEGNVNGLATGWERLENAERVVLNDEYEGVTNVCGPGTATGGAVQSNSTNAANTPFGTAFRNAKYQYFFRASELVNFGLCPGNITEIAFFVLDDDVQSPTPAAIDAEFTLYGTAVANPLAGGFVAAVSAAPANGTLTNYVIGSGTLPVTLTTPFNWNGTDNLIIEVCWTKGAVTGVNPRVQLTTTALSAALTWTYYGYDAFANIGCNMDMVNPGTATRGSVPQSRPVIRFTGQALGPQPILAFGDYAQYDGGLMIGTPAWAAANFRGPGVIRAENAVYDNNVQLSDHVFDTYFDGEARPEEVEAAAKHSFVPLDELGDYLAENRHLPNMPSRSEWESKGSLSLGELSTRLWQTVEDQALYIVELENQLRTLERMTYSKGLTDGEVHELIAAIRRNKGLSEVQKNAMIEEVLGKRAPQRIQED